MDGGRAVLWQNAVVLRRLTERKEWKFFGVLPKADPGLAAAWWAALLLRGVLPAAFAIAMGVLVGAVQRGDSLAGPLAFAGTIFVLLQVLGPIHQAVSANLGDRTAAWLYDRLTEACVRPPGMGHLEDPALTSDLTVARDFDLGMTGPPLVDLHGFHRQRHGRDDRRYRLRRDPRQIRVVGADRARGRVAGDALAAARERDLVRPQHRGGARRAAGRRLRLPAGGGPAGEQGTAAVRPRRLDDRPLHRQTHPPARAAVRGHAAARASGHLERAPGGFRQRLVFWLLASAAAAGRISLGGGRRLRAERHRRVDDRVRRIQLGARRSGCARRRGAAARAGDASRRRAALRRSPRGRESRRARFASAMSHSRTLPARRSRVLEHFDLTIPAGSSLAIVGQNGAGKTTIAKLLCRLYDPQSGAIEIDGVDLREFDLASWRSRVAAVFQDFIRLELPLRDNVAPAGAPDDVVRARARVGGSGEPGRTRHGAGPRVRPAAPTFGRPVAARRARPRAGGRHARRRRRAARRADRAARRARAKRRSSIACSPRRGIARRS